jgi:hypothetical protein
MEQGSKFRRSRFPGLSRPRMRYNQRKRQALSIFAAHGWLNPPAWANLASFSPTRSAYSYLIRLYRFGLLQRRRGLRGLVFYRLSMRGQRRLEWLLS